MKATVAPAAGAARTADAELLQQAQSGDRAAQDALVRRYLPDVYRVALRVLGTREAAEDAAQDTFVNALQALPRFRGESSLRTWLLRIAVNAARSHGRRWTRRREVGLEELAAAASPGDAGSDAERGEASRRLELALAQLPPRQRLVVTLRTQQGLTYREIAAVSGGTEGAARVNYHLGIKRLREVLT